MEEERERERGREREGGGGDTQIAVIKLRSNTLIIICMHEHLVCVFACLTPYTREKN